LKKYKPILQEVKIAIDWSKIIQNDVLCQTNGIEVITNKS
jgi:hypothetical protein